MTQPRATEKTKGKSGAKWDSVNITDLHQISRENTPSVNLRMKSGWQWELAKKNRDF
jgi:hypothetical protein